MWKNKCKACGAENARKNSFCAQCGMAMEQDGGQDMKCLQCGIGISASARFCPGCGERMGGDQKPVSVDGQWCRTQGDFATAMDTRDLKEALKNGLVVEQGTHALLFHNGKYIDRLPPGRHQLSTVGDRLLSFMSKAAVVKVILADAGVAPLRFLVDGLKTADPLFVKLECDLMIRIQDPDVFYLNLFKQRRNFGLREISDWLSDEIRNALYEEMRKISIKDFAGDRDIKDRLADAIRAHLQKTLSLYGLEVVQCRTLSVSHPRYNEIESRQEDLALAVWEKESDLMGRKKLFDVSTEEKRQDLFEATRKAEHEEKRAEIYPRIRRAIMTGKIDEIRGEQEFAAFLDEIDTEKLLRQEEKQELIRTFAEKREDHDLARRHLLVKIDIEQKIERRRMELIGEQGLEKEVLEARLKTLRLQFEHDLNQKLEVAEMRRSEALKDELSRLERELAASRAEKDKEEIRLEIKRNKWEFGQSILERQRAAKLSAQNEEMRLEAEQQERQLMLKLKEQEHSQRAELERMKAFSEASTEAIIATADTDKAKIIAELKKTEMLGGFTEDKILAMAAEKSPEVAKAFQERFRSANADQIQGLYERMLVDKDAVLDKYRGEQKDTRADMKEITLEALRGQRPISQVVYPPAGQVGRLPEMNPACPACGEIVRPGSRFCVSCGHNFS